MDWVSNITAKMIELKKNEALLEKMQRAEQVCRRLWEKYPGEMLLHGDLHHDNILLGDDNRYRIIDPKGVVGDVVFDIPRFILNEFFDDMDDEFYQRYTHITKTLADKLNMPEYDIRCLVFVEISMANCWTVEDGDEVSAQNYESVLFAEKLMEELKE
jgi:streptomycin 6-kinase